MDRAVFFQELRRVLQREGFTTQAVQDGLLPVEWEGHPLCQISEGASTRYTHTDVDTPEREQACQRAADLACMVREYTTLLEQAPPLRAQELTGDFRVLADFNGTVLAGHQTKFGIHFVTWNRDFRWTGLNYGHYFQENYVAAKQDFAIRSGLVPQHQDFNQEQLTEIFHCCADTLNTNLNLSPKQEACIRDIQEQIENGIPDVVHHIKEQEQRITEPYIPQHTM